MHGILNSQVPKKVKNILFLLLKTVPFFATVTVNNMIDVAGNEAYSFNCYYIYIKLHSFLKSMNECSVYMHYNMYIFSYILV